MFFTEFHDVLGGFRQRAEETFELLRQPRGGFVLVSSPEPVAVREALAFHDRLVSSKMPLAGFIVNKVHRSRPAAVTVAELERLLAAEPGVAALGLSGTSVRMAADRVRHGPGVVRVPGRAVSGGGAIGPRASGLGPRGGERSPATW